MTRLITAAACTAAVAVPAVVVTSAVAGGPTAHAATKSCSEPNYPGDGYFTSLKVTGTSCRSGKKVALDHYRCRIKHGKKGRCRSVDGYTCTEHREGISTEYNSRTTCKKGTRRVVFTYQQNL